jgi:hypothetical protein
VDTNVDLFAGLRQAIADATAQGMGDLAASLSQELGMDQKYSDYLDGLKKMNDDANHAAKAAADMAAANKSLLQAQLVTEQKSLSTLQSQLQEAQSQVDATQKVVDTLTTFQQSLSLNSSLTTLSPGGQLAEAQRQYGALVAQALGGNQTAATGVPQAAQTLLTLAKQYYGSTMGYVQIFNKVQSDLGTLTQKFGTELTTEQQNLAELQKQTSLQQQVVDLLQQQLDTQQADAAQQWINAVLSNNATGSLGDAIAQVQAKYPGVSFTSILGQGVRQSSFDYRSSADYWASVYSNSSVEDIGKYAGALKFNASDVLKKLKASYWNTNELHYDATMGYYWLGGKSGDVRPFTPGVIPPAFGYGGTHLGGWRVVGDRGPELEMTGQAQYMTASRVAMGAGDVITELRALRKEMKDTREQVVKVQMDSKTELRRIRENQQPVSR